MESAKDTNVKNPTTRTGFSTSLAFSPAATSLDTENLPRPTHFMCRDDRPVSPLHFAASGCLFRPVGSAFSSHKPLTVERPRTVSPETVEDEEELMVLKQKFIPDVDPSRDDYFHEKLNEDNGPVELRSAPTNLGVLRRDFIDERGGSNLKITKDDGPRERGILRPVGCHAVPNRDYSMLSKQQKIYGKATLGHALAFVPFVPPDGMPNNCYVDKDTLPHSRIVSANNPKTRNVKSAFLSGSKSEDNHGRRQGTRSKEKGRVLKPDPRSKKRKKMYSDFVGVTYNKTHAKYQACITHYRKQHYLGRYRLAVDAARAYDKSAKILKGKGWKINFSTDEEYEKAKKEEEGRYAYATVEQNDSQYPRSWNVVNGSSSIAYDGVLSNENTEDINTNETDQVITQCIENPCYTSDKELLVVQEAASALMTLVDGV